MDLSQPSLLSSKILIHTKELHRNQPILDFLCNIQSKWLKQSHDPLKFKMVRYWVSVICLFFIFLIQNVLLWKAPLLNLGQNHISFKWLKFLNCSHHAVHPVLLQSWVKLVWKSLCEQIKVLYSTGLFFLLFLKIKTIKTEIHWSWVILPLILTWQPPELIFILFLLIL